jgi:polygalacturonase
LWKEFVADSPSALLPDFSYSGYHHGEKAIPEIKGPVFNVVDYGAVPNNGKNASAAIQAAVDACEAAGVCVVFFQTVPSSSMMTK